MKIDEKIRCIRKYGWYLTKHRFFVMLECFKKRMIWRGLIHDLSKLSPKEFFPYAFHFYQDKKPKRDENGWYKPTDTGNPDFELAWLHHVHKNKHHWQYWAICADIGETKFYEIPDKYLMEMLCDWVGAGKAQKSFNMPEWYKRNRYKVCFSQKTRDRLEKLMNDF